MAGLLCKCGYEMSDSTCPSPCELYVYIEKEVQDAITYCPTLEWFDFICGWDPLTESRRNYFQRSEEMEYWYCPKCKRVHEVETRTGRVIRIYKRTKRIPAESEKTNSLCVYSAVEVYPYTEAIHDLTLDWFVYHIPHKYSYKISEDEMKVTAYDHEGNPVFAYVFEERIDWSKRSDASEDV